MSYSLNSLKGGFIIGDYIEHRGLGFGVQSFGSKLLKRGLYRGVYRGPL